MPNTPDIRFKGFTEPWEQRKLGELAQFSKGTGYSKADLKETGTPIILYGRLYTKYETVITDVDTFADAKIGSVYSHGGEVIIPASGETAEDISIASVVEKSGVLLGGDLNIITPPDDIDSAFLAIRISNGKPHNDMAKLAQGKSVVHLHNTDLEKVELLYPKYKEQLQISSCFRQIDNLINLHQCKCDEMSELKKFMLQKMFPKNGEQFPEIRFSGFTDHWERRELEDMYQKIRNAFVGTATPYYVDSGHLYLESNNVKDGQINYNTEVFINDDFYERQKDNWLHTGDLVMVQSGHVGHTAVIPESLNNTAAHALIIIANPVEKTSPYFVNYQFQTQCAKDGIDNITTGNTIKHILSSEIKKFEIVVPSYEEQSKIGTYFQQLDHLITLHQRKHDELKELKKYMLQNMFPKKG